MENTIQPRTDGVGALLPDPTPITERLDRVVEVGKGVRTAMLILAGALVLHAIVVVAKRPRE